MQEIEVRMNMPVLPPWDTVVKIAERINPDRWLLVGGLMVQAHRSNKHAVEVHNKL